MSTERRFASVASLGPLVREAFGEELERVERLRGGTKKGVYRLTFERGPTAVLYVWAAEENFWGAGAEKGRSEMGLFLAAHREFSELGVRVPELRFVDGSGRLYPGEVAVVESGSTSGRR
ncbi:hypothetical protein ABZW11_04830 [Nonomuraea sp. NPDC004580]|uniref:hypothetical protein n=1 Tax=Nonomuraea sp. NPDC004580 TaxID=3154552 RepID=UPI0033BEBDB6